MIKAMSQKKFVENKGKTCPVCGSDYIEIDNNEEVVTSDNDAMTYLIAMQCGECQSYWSDKAKITGYTDLEVNGDITEITVNGVTKICTESDYDQIMSILA